MILDLILIAVFILFAVNGLRRGGLAAGVSLFSIVFAYVGGIVGAKYGAQPLLEATQIVPFIATPVAGLAGFTLTYFSFGFIGGRLVRFFDERSDDDERGGFDRFVGGVIGGMHGGLVLLLLGWLAIWVDAARDLDVLTLAKDKLPQTEDSRLAGLTSRVVEEVAVRALGDGNKQTDAQDAGVRVITRLLANPGSALSGLQDLLEDDRIARLQQDRMFWVLIENGASDSALNRLSFYQIAHDAGLRQSLADLGIISAEAAKSATAFHEDATAVFDDVGPKLRGLRDDPAIREMSKDPEIVSMLERGDTLALIQHPEIRRLVDRIAGQAP
jgi:uncharacterized membrane protein required for colicin V production